MKALVLLLLPGCALGVGSAYVGKWRPREHVDVEACLVDEQGNCREQKQIVSASPAKHFWGSIITFPSLGASAVDHAGSTDTGLRAEAGLEVLQGYGTFGWGVRSSLVVDGHAGSVPIDLIGHYSLSERVGLYAGAGFSPYAHYSDDHMSETSLLGGRVLAGLQLRAAEHILFDVEADTLWIHFTGGYRSTGVTGHLGLFF